MWSVLHFQVLLLVLTFHRNSEPRRAKSEVTTRRRPVARSLDEITEQPFLPGQDVNLGRRYRKR